MFIKIAGVESIYSLKSGRLSNERLSIIATDAIAIKAYIIKKPIKSHANEELAAKAKTKRLNQNNISPK